MTDGSIRNLCINVPPGCGKALDEATPVLTTWGWKRHGDLAPGDFVFGPDGKPKRVIACTPDSEQEAFEVEFDDGASVTASGEHEWEVERDVMSVAPRYKRGRKRMVVETKHLRLADWKKPGTDQRPDRIVITAPIDNPPLSLSIDPYILGAWLGDGASSSGCIYAGEQDSAHFLQYGRIGTVYAPNGARKQNFYRIQIEGLQTRLRLLGLLNNKAIPDDYLRSSIEQRWALLQGLMDTDGTVSKEGTCSFSNKSDTLAIQMHELAQSLGLKAVRRPSRSKLAGVDYGIYWTVSFTPPAGARIFRLARKQSRVKGAVRKTAERRYVRVIRHVGRRLMKCIQVEGGLYLSGRGLVVTHNSLIVSVFFPAFEWGPLKRPELRYISTSHSAAFSVRDSRKMRDLISSEWYQGLWPHVRLTRAGESSFGNDRQGFREAMPYTQLTGARGDRVMIDDPQAAEDAESPPERARALRVFREVIPTRINDARTSAIVLIMQRLNDQDVSAAAIEAGYTHLMLPMEFEPERRCRTVLGVSSGKPRIFQDPRQRDGDLMFPQRFPREEIDKLKSTMGSFAWAGQMQQRPVPREGGLFKAAWFTEDKFIDAAPGGTQWVRHWDLAASTGEGAAYTAGVKLGRDPSGRYIVGHVIRFRAGPGAVQERILAVAQTIDGIETTISLPQDPGAGGKVAAFEYIKALHGFVAYAIPETGSKEQRAVPVAVQAEIGNLFVVRGEWNAAFLDELYLFPGSKYKDQVDALSGAFSRLSKTADVPIVGAVVESRTSSIPGGLTPHQTW